MNDLMARLQVMTMGRAVMIGIVVAAMYWFVSEDGSNIKASIENSKNRLVAAKKELETINQAVATVEEYENMVATLGSELKTLSTFIPEEFSSTDLLKITANEAKAAGLEILSISESRGKASGKEGLFEEFYVDANLRGNFSQALLFMSFLTNLERIVTLGKFSMQTERAKAQDSSDTQVEFNSRLVGYRYIGNRQPDPNSRRRRGAR